MLDTFTNFLFTHTPLLYITQSLWRDEAFSVWIAKDSLIDVIARTSGDFNPPFYYLLLNIWITVFGKSEIMLRFLSLIFHVGLVFTMYLLAKKLFSQKTFPPFVFLLTLFNPMLLYFGMELRMYSLLALLATLSMYAFITKRWKMYTLITALGLYTQPYMLFVLLAQNLYLWRTKNLTQAIKNSVIIGLLFTPWLPVLLGQFAHSGPMWIYPVDATLVTSVLANLYIGYEGSPGYLWPFMQLASLGFTIVMFLLWKKKPTKDYFLLLLWIFVPLSLVLGISFIKPLYVARYVIMVTPALVLFLTLAVKELCPRKLHVLSLCVILICTIAVNFWNPRYKTKVDIRSTFSLINPMVGANDIIVAETPLVFYESVYYARQNTPVRLYNPQSITPPRYVGSVGMPEDVWLTQFPDYPSRAYLIHEDGTFTIHSRL